MKKTFLLFLIFSINSFSQGFKRSADFYKKANFIEISRTSKPVKKSLESYTSCVLNQRGGTCVNHAVSQGMTILYALATKSTEIEKNLNKSFSPYFNHLKLNNSLDDGQIVLDFLDYVIDNGSPLTKLVEFNKFFPFNSKSLDLSKMKKKDLKIANEDAKKYRLKKYKHINSIDGIKQSISLNYPVVYGLDYIPNSLKELINCKADDCYWEPKQSDKLEPGSFGGHAVLIVGYDDEKQAIKILNSWGSDFGNNGFFWIKYEDVFSPIIKHPDYPCWIDLGSGYCFSDEDYTLYKDDFTNGEIWSLVKQYERLYDEELPTGNGFGSEAYSLQGLINNDVIEFLEEKEINKEMIKCDDLIE